MINKLWIAGVGWFVLFCGTIRAETRPLTAEALFDPQHLVEVIIELPESDWDKLRLQTRCIVESLGTAPEESPFTYVKGNVTIDSVRIDDVGIRKKGFLGSLDEDRPSLKIKFDEYKDQSPVAGLDRLTLNNNKQDSSRLSQFLSYKLFNESGTVAPRCNLAKVTVNGTYLGIYSHVESIEPSFLERGFGDGMGALFEGTLADLTTDVLPRFELKNKRSKVEDLEPLTALLNQETLALHEIERYLDIEAFLKYWATESLIGFWDGYTNNQNNFFIYRNPVNEKFYFIPWGTDSSFTKSVPSIFRIRQRSVHGHSVLANRLYRIPDIQERYRRTLLELLETHWNEDRLIAEVDRVEAAIGDFLYEGNKDFSKAIGKVRSFIKSRRSVIMRELENWPLELVEGPRRPFYFRPIGTAEATFSTQWFAKSPKKSEMLGEIDLEVRLEEEPVSFRKVGVTAAPSDERTSSGGRKPGIVITGKRDSDGKRFAIATRLAVDHFRPTGEPVVVDGMFIEGGTFGFLLRTFLFGEGFTMVGGRVTFEEAAMEPGAPVKGRMELKIMKLAGGDPMGISG